jgi:hypothetical protein
VHSVLETECFELPLMNTLYTRYLWYLSLLMDAFLLSIVLFSSWGVPAGVVAVFAYVALASRAYLFLLGTIVKRFQSERMMLYGVEFAGAGAFAAAYGSQVSGVVLICAGFVLQLCNRPLSAEVT